MSSVPPPPDRLLDPGAAALAAAWRTEVGRFRAAQPRRAFPQRMHVGVPAGHRLSLEAPWPLTGEYDAALLFDLVDALVDGWRREGGSAAYAWLTRPGVPALHDYDVAWHAAAQRSFGAHEVELLGFRAVTRSGWIDVRTGERRTWKRLRL